MDAVCLHGTRIKKTRFKVIPGIFMANIRFFTIFVFYPGIMMILKKSKDISCELCLNAFHRFFSVLDKADLLYLNDQKEQKTYKKGQVIYDEGQKSNGVYCIKEGQVKVFKNGFDGRERVVRIVFPGDFLGLRALLSGHDHTTTATTLEDTSVCFIHKSDFLQLIVKYPEFSQRLIQELSSLLDKAESRLIAIAHRPVRERLAETLLFLLESFHNTSPAYPPPYLNLSRLDIANIIGTTPETIIRLLSQLKQEHIISIKGRKIMVLDRPRLEFIANSKY
jgi:CRP/FNR family transcriptional regulator, polysaccharide utilization system transcription regulator